jgi:hypothetical protein
MKSDLQAQIRKNRFLEEEIQQKLQNESDIVAAGEK